MGKTPKIPTHISAIASVKLGNLECFTRKTSLYVFLLTHTLRSFLLVS